ncbi:protein NDR1-like [Papaver somniferum]|uniref:protein NDR1-like n=1 Tax=Papaver somniferum TaxID=3469 RepID=UPI000E6F75E1|nr:protein NDR1-like [Papaver somniferum]
MFIAILITLCLISSVKCISPPNIYLKKFDVPGLDGKASNASQVTGNATTISVELSFWNLISYGAEQQQTVYYDNINLAVYYFSNSNSKLATGNFTIPEFHHRFAWSTHRTGTIKTLGVPWEEARTEVSSGRMAIFRIELDTKTRYSNGIWKSKRHDLRVGTNVTINDRGTMSSNNDLKLSSALVYAGDCVRVGIVALSVLVLHILM